MKIYNTRLKGFIGIKQGLGLDEVSVDLSGVNGLIAFDGPNGKGKSTLLEAGLQPYRCLASRKGALQHHTFLRDSEKELTFTYQGDEYRTLIKIDAQSGRQEGFIWRNQAPQVNGKSSEYDRYITELFGSSTLFFNSVFCAQNSSKISDMTTGELKSLFSEFLRLQRYIDFEEDSKQRAKILLGQSEILEGEISRLESDAGKYAGISERLQCAQEGHGISTEGINGSLKALEMKESELAEAKTSASKNQIIKQQLEALKKSEAEIELEIEDTEAQSASELRVIREKAQGVVSEINVLESVLNDKAIIIEAVAKVEELKKEFDSLKADLSEAQVSMAEAVKAGGEWRLQLRMNESAIQNLKNDETLCNLTTEIRMAEATAKSLELKDPDCQSKLCSFISEAIKASETLPGLIDIRDKFQAKIKTEIEVKAAEGLRIRVEINKAAELENDLSTHLVGLKKKALTVNVELKEVAITAEKERQIEAAEIKLEGLRQRKNELISQGLRVKDRYEKLMVSILDRRLHAQNQVAEFEAQYDHEVDKRLENHTREIAGLKEGVAIMRGRAETLAREIVSLEQQVKERDTAEATLKEHKQRLLTLTSEVSEWRYLQHACGKDGLRALEIDSVAPLVTGYSNELLANTFGPSFSVRFRTQDDEGREVLDILVIREDGTEVLLDNLSGGQKIWNLTALRLALTLLTKERSGKQFDSCFADEIDGALDVENAMKFVSMYRSFMSAGDFSDLYFISHRPECVLSADHRIIFNGGIRVE